MWKVWISLLSVYQNVIPWRGTADFLIDHNKRNVARAEYTFKTNKAGNIIYSKLYKLLGPTIYINAIITNNKHCCKIKLI